MGVESLYAHLTSSENWEMEESEGRRAAKCAHVLLALLHSYSERFRYLKNPHHQLMFFEGTQLHLLEIFLKEVAGMKYCMTKTVLTIVIVLREWKDWSNWREWWGSASSSNSARLVEMMEKWCIFANSLLLIRSAIKEWGDQLVCMLLLFIILTRVVFPIVVQSKIGGGRGIERAGRFSRIHF